MKKTHYYLVDTSVIIPGAAVSELQFDIIHEKPFIVHDLKVRIRFLDIFMKLITSMKLNTSSLGVYNKHGDNCSTVWDRG